jgi:hypothetical protein
MDAKGGGDTAVSDYTHSLLGAQNSDKQSNIIIKKAVLEQFQFRTIPVHFFSKKMVFQTIFVF